MEAYSSSYHCQTTTSNRKNATCASLPQPGSRPKSEAVWSNAPTLTRILRHKRHHSPWQRLVKWHYTLSPPENAMLAARQKIASQLDKINHASCGSLRRQTCRLKLSLLPNKSHPLDPIPFPSGLPVSNRPVTYRSLQDMAVP